MKKARVALRITTACALAAGICSNSYAVDERVVGAQQAAAAAAAQAHYSAYANIHPAPASDGIQISIGNYTSPVYPNTPEGIDEALNYLGKLVDEKQIKTMPQSLTFDFSGDPAAASKALEAVQQSSEGKFTQFKQGVTVEGVSAASPDQMGKLKDAMKSTASANGTQFNVIVSTDSGACALQTPPSDRAAAPQTDARICK
ncbi:MAG TPA: hypothetical protein VFT64_08915 [Rickettsiales bacterium]|nr:hypothetical protein [Rickettsiales bacterium]